MKKIGLFCLMVFSGIFSNSYVSYIQNPGRLGDQILCYLHAKWISYKYNIPLMVVPFDYYDQLALSVLESNFITRNDINKFLNQPDTYVLKPGKEFELNKNCMHLIPYFPESLEEHRPRNNNHPYKKANYRPLPDVYFKVEWDKPEFKNLVQKLIAPRYKIDLIFPPKNVYSIALHIRKGRHFDPPLLSETPKSQRRADEFYHDVGAPWKVPPDDYYIEQIKRVLNMVTYKNIYIHIFTDDSDQKKLLEKYKNVIADSRVTWNIRTDKNNHDMNVLEDLFSMAYNFDCLIRGDSNLSIVADIVGNHKLVFSPADSDFIDNELVITKVRVKKMIDDKVIYSIEDNYK